MLINAIERIFGVLKRRFRILLLPPEYDISVQVRIPPALCLVHNVIRIHDPNDIPPLPDLQSSDTERDIGVLANSIPTEEARTRSHTMRDAIATAMWYDYNLERLRRGLSPVTDSV